MILVEAFAGLVTTSFRLHRMWCRRCRVLLQQGTPLQVLYVVFISLVESKMFVDACIWDEFLVTAAALEHPTIAIPQGFAGFDEIHPFSCNKYTS